MRRQLEENGIAPHIVDRIFAEKNWAFAISRLDNGPRRIIWAVSGEGGGYTYGLVDDFLSSTGRRVAGSSTGRLIASSEQAGFHTEIKILEDLLQRYENLGPGHYVSIDMYTVRQPCYSCGGRLRIQDWDVNGIYSEADIPAGLMGVIGQFDEMLWNREIQLEMNVFYSRQWRAN